MDELIKRLAIQAGFDVSVPGAIGIGSSMIDADALLRFAALVAAECARMVDDHEYPTVYEACDVMPAMADAIRAKFKMP